MINLAPERFTAIQHEIMPLWCEHYAEIGQDKERVPLDPDWDRYVTLDAGGHLAIITARSEGHLIGYAFALVSTHLHYRSTLFAHMDLYFLLPRYRGGRTAWRLFRAMEDELQRRGVVKAMGNTKLAHDQAKLLSALGWRESERLFVKLLGAA